jgi:hypothetical protein
MVCYCHAGFFGTHDYRFSRRLGIRFRLVGVTSFMTVLTVGIFGLGLGLFTRTEIPGAVRFSLVYDNGANQAVISLPNTVTPEQVEATLKQAASDLFSSGRAGAGGNNQFIISARTLVHPQPRFICSFVPGTD